MSILAFEAMVLKSTGNANCLSSCFSRFFHHGSLSFVTEALPLSGVAYWFHVKSETGISREIAKCELQSIVKDTLVGYQRHWEEFSRWCASKKVCYSSLSVDDVCRYLNYKFKEGTKSGTLNNISASSFFTGDSFVDLGQDKDVCVV